MAEVGPARDLVQRTQDTLRLLEQEIDAWVATANPDSGSPYMIPLSFLWESGALLIATFAASPTGRNITAGGEVRLGIGKTRDVVLIEGTAEAIEMTALSPATADAFAAKTGFDPRQSSSPFLYFRITPKRILAWREENELANRVIMRDGRWLAND